MVAIWTPEARIRREREFWIAVMEAQRELGAPIPQDAVSAYRSVIDEIDLSSIKRRELRTRHDVAARLEEFCSLAGCEFVHWGLTSRDLTENVEQAQIRDSLKLLFLKAVAALRLMAQRAQDFATITYVGRTHNVPAQATSAGRLFSVFGEELLWAVECLGKLIDDYPLRGLKGPVGVQRELLSLFDGDESRVEALEDSIAEFLGFSRRMSAVGQVYPRSLDFAVAAAVFGLLSGPASFATTLRLMSGTGLAGEGFAEGQVGSSAMPHKMNARSSERICALVEVLRGHVVMAAGLAGRQWYEGDVSCSSTRRVLFPDLFLASDGALETLLVVVDEMQFFEQAALEEMNRQLATIASSALLSASVSSGAARSAAHAAVQTHSLAAAAAARNGESYDLIQKLAADDALPLEAEAIRGVIEQAASGSQADSQILGFVRSVEYLVDKNPEACEIKVGAIP